MITWKFEQAQMTFVSKPENLDRDISKMSYANHIDPSTKIIILHDSRLDSSDSANSNVSASCPTVESLQIPAKKTKTGKATVQLRDVSGDVGGSDPADTELPSTDNSVADSSASDWFSDQRV